MHAGNLSSSSFLKSPSSTPSAGHSAFSDGRVFSASDPEPDEQGEPAESSDIVGLGASERHLSCSSVIFSFESSPLHSVVCCDQ
ncbi:hypothetical protein AMECASPLE_012965 [Ameca splendens]|uniref:Uncharacterized protein n=1 Tax=Ameca splendens TaxID=208324 RepID=A0ABV0ZKZ7_9TELE